MLVAMSFETGVSFAISPVNFPTPNSLSGIILTSLETLFIKMGADILPILGGALMDLIMAISQVWDAAKGDLMPIFERLATETIPRFIEILKKVGPDAITGFVQGLEDGINALTWLLDVLEPHLPALSKFLGYLVGIAPILTAVGMGLFFMSVPLQMVASFVGTLNGLFGAIAGTAGATTISFAALGAILLILAGITGALHFTKMLGISGSPPHCVSCPFADILHFFSRPCKSTNEYLKHTNEPA